MQRPKKIKPISDFNTNAPEAITEMTATGEPPIIPQNSEATEEAMALRKIFALGRKQIEEGKFKPAREVFAKLDKSILK